jgi:hypothetical protein
MELCAPLIDTLYSQERPVTAPAGEDSNVNVANPELLAKLLLMDDSKGAAPKPSRARSAKPAKPAATGVVKIHNPEVYTQ